MSSLHIDASGSRSLSMTVNDEARTSVTIPSRQDDDVNVQINSAAEIRLSLPPSARIERRQYPVKTYNADTQGYDETGETGEAYTIVLGDAEAESGAPNGQSQSMSMSIRNARAEGRSQMHPHVSISARKDMPVMFDASGKVVSSESLDDLFHPKTAG